jgi:hypothetical protein
MAAVTMPDGQTVEMPDQLDPALGARLRAFHDSQVTSNPSAGDIAKGVGDAALSGVSKISSGIVAAPVALANRLVAALSGGDPQMAADAAHDYVNSHFNHNTETPVGKAIGSTVSSALAPAGNLIQGGKNLLQKGGEALGVPADTMHSQLSELGDIVGTAGTVAPLAAGAAASSEAATLAAQNAPAAIAKYGFKTAEDNPIARNVAGASGREALTLHNQPLGNTVLGAEAGVPHGTELSYQSLENGRTAPNTVYARVASALPEGPLSEGAQSAIQSAGGIGQRMTEGTPDALDAINGLKTQLLAPGKTWNGNQIVNEMRGLRQEGYVNASSDDVSKQQLGKAQIGMAGGLEQHVADSLPEGSPVSMDQLATARTALAKNYAIQGALRGPDVDMQAIARMQRADPGLLTGPLADIADFANRHPEVSSLPGAGVRYNPPGLANDVASISLKSPQTWTQPLLGALARRMLTGGQGSAMEAAQTAPVAGAAGEFAPLDSTPGPLTLTPPPGQAFSPHQPDLATGATPQRDLFGFGTGGMRAESPNAPAPAAAGPPGQISLADLLSTGVGEHQPEPELTAGPMGEPQGEGIPFQRNAAHEAGPLSLLDDILAPAGQSVTPPRTASKVAEPGEPPQHPSLSDLLEGLRDHPAVMSQGVPEGIMSRTPQVSRPNVGSLTLSDLLQGMTPADTARLQDHIDF